ncbi:MAG: MazG family protein [Simkaniaceae bacterium]|nr:MazG family protein [Simkaniaceae bacterium]
MKSFDELLELADHLNSPEGCPWDREQTYESLRPYLLEEAHEVLDAVDQGDIKNLIEELGDLIYIIIFYAKLGEKKEEFDIDQILTNVRKKLIRRHPHVFGEEKAESAADVVHHWNRIKDEEKKGKNLLDGIPPGLSIVLKSQKVIKRLERAFGPLLIKGEGVGPDLLRLILKAHYEGIDAETELRQSLRGLIDQSV